MCNNNLSEIISILFQHIGGYKNLYIDLYDKSNRDNVYLFIYNKSNLECKNKTNITNTFIFNFN